MSVTYFICSLGEYPELAALLRSERAALFSLVEFGSGDTSELSCEVRVQTQLGLSDLKDIHLYLCWYYSLLATHFGISTGSTDNYFSSGISLFGQHKQLSLPWSSSLLLVLFGHV